MTDKYGVPDLPEDEPTPPLSEPDVVEHDDASVIEGAGDFTSGEGLVAFAGIILIAVWLIFEVILDDYGISSIYLLLAAAAVLVPRLNPDTVAKVMPVNVIMKIVGYTFGIGGIIVLIGDIETSSLDGFSTVIAALLTYAAFAMGFVGARQIEI